MSEFKGFSQHSLTFLQQLRQNNTKEWFEEHRHIYTDTLLEPFRALVSELGFFMQQIDDMFEIRPGIGQTLSRIHRDTRFSHDKSPYRSNMWLTFKRTRKNWTDAPTFFFEIGVDWWQYGLGYYCASKTTMDLFRQSLRDNPKSFLKMAASLPPTITLEGESYKRPLIKDQPDELATWYNRKSFAVTSIHHDMETLFSNQLVRDLQQGFGGLEQLYHYLMQIEGLKKSAEESNDIMKWYGGPDRF